MKKPLCPECGHRVENHGTQGCLMFRSTGGGRVYRCGCSSPRPAVLKPLPTKTQRIRRMIDRIRKTRVEDVFP